MFNLTKILGIAVLSTIPCFIYTNSAHAIGLRLNLGIGDNPNTDQIEKKGQHGSFSDYYNQDLYPNFQDNAITVDFNSVGVNQKKFGYTKDGTKTSYNDGFIKYHLKTKSSIVKGGKKDGEWKENAGDTENNKQARWAPSGPNGEINQSKYLQALTGGSKIVIDFADQMNYFGFNWGAISDNNLITFVNTKTNKRTLQRFISKENKSVIEVQDEHGNKIKEFNLADLAQGDKPKTVKAPHHNEYNTFAHFFAEKDDQTFNQIIIEQTSDQGGGFEIDNHTFHVGNTAFNPKQSIPEPSLILGMLAVGGVSIYQRRRQKLAY